jgi:hypothetical protein
MGLRKLLLPLAAKAPASDRKGSGCLTERGLCELPKGVQRKARKAMHEVKAGTISGNG